jgi:hypothetical protein
MVLSPLARQTSLRDGEGTRLQVVGTPEVSDLSGISRVRKGETESVVNRCAVPVTTDASGLAARKCPRPSRREGEALIADRLPAFADIRTGEG